MRLRARLLLSNSDNLYHVLSAARHKRLRVDNTDLQTTLPHISVTDSSSAHVARTIDPFYTTAIFMPPPTTGGAGIMFSGRLAGRPSVVHPLTTMSRYAISLCLVKGISMKLATNIHHCWKDFQGQKSKVKVMTKPINSLYQRYTPLRCDVEAHLLKMWTLCEWMWITDITACTAT